MVDISHLKESKKLEKFWKKTYIERRKKTSKKRAKISADAKVYSEALKFFNSKKKINLFEVIDKPKDYKTYVVGNNKISVSMNDKILKEFPMAERKGIIKQITHPFEREIISTLLKDKKIQLDPNMYYVINGDG